MAKNIIIRLVIVLAVLALIYSAFWFFKAGQIEKQITGFVSDNSRHVSIGPVSVAGFPLNQKINIKNLNFRIPSKALNKHQNIIGEIEAIGNPFSSFYKVTKFNSIRVKYEDDKEMAVEFKQNPEVSFSLAGGMISKLDYQDRGYKIANDQGKTIYSSDSVTINYRGVIDESEKVQVKIIANVKGILGIDTLEIYKNSSEKRIIQGIKTGEITLGNGLESTIQEAEPVPNAADVIALDDKKEVVVAKVIEAKIETPTKEVTTNDKLVDAVSEVAVAPTQEIASKSSEALIVQNQKLEVANNQVKEAVKSTVKSPVVEEVAISENVEGQDNVVEQKQEIIKKSIKSDFMMNLEFVLTPNNSGGLQIPSNPDQVQEISAVQYSKVLNIKHFEFSNELFKIFINGQLEFHQDDNMPSGTFSVNVEKPNNFFSHFADGLKHFISKPQEDLVSQAVEIAQLEEKVEQKAQEIEQLANQQPNPEEKIVIPQNLEATTQSSIQVEEQPIVTDIIEKAKPRYETNSYDYFLDRVSTNLVAVASEIAAKSEVSKDDFAVYDFRREKNLEFLINETSTREILGKF